MSEGDLELLPGEVINLRLERVGVFYGSTCGLDPQGGHGSLLVTNYQMSFNWGGKKPVNVPHLNFIKVTKRDRVTDKRSEDWDSDQSKNPLTHKMGMVHLERRDTTPMTIILFAASTLIDAVNDELYPNPTRQCSKLYECLMSYVFPRSLTKVFAFSYRQTFEADVDGWRCYNPDEEFARQGVMDANSGWRVSHVNHEYAACESYPRKVAVPAAIRDWEIKKALEFRASGRFPVMVWKNPRSNAVICRSAQPLPGLFRMRNKEDERLVALVRGANPSPAPLYIIDARPHTNAQANTVFRAAGYERGSYEKCEIVFLGIENIHAVRKAYQRLRELCTSPPVDDDERWLQQVQETYWLQHISKLLQGARRIAELVMIERASVLIHCSDGWDRTPQISALAQMMIDPFYRTIRGFQVVVEKEWCALGHKFSLRYAHGGSGDKQESAPVMAQWADCIWQMMRQFPTAFELNEAYLLELIEMVHVCKFGTFLFNTEGERRRAGVHKKTVSFWSMINSNLEKYRNPHYVPYSGLIFPETSVRRLWVWEGLFFRDCTSLPPPQDHCPAPALERQAEAAAAELAALRGTEKLQQRYDALAAEHQQLTQALQQAVARERDAEWRAAQLEALVLRAGLPVPWSPAPVLPGGEGAGGSGSGAAGGEGSPSWFAPDERGWMQKDQPMASTGEENGRSVVKGVSPASSGDTARDAADWGMHLGYGYGWFSSGTPPTPHSGRASSDAITVSSGHGALDGGRHLVLPVSAGAAEDWHQTVRLRAEALNTPPEVAEALTDMIDCVAAQHGQRIHMSHASMGDNTWRRTSFPSRPSMGREATPSGSHKPPLVWGEEGVPPRPAGPCTTDQASSLSPSRERDGVAPEESWSGEEAQGTGQGGGSKSPQEWCSTEDLSTDAEFGRDDSADLWLPEGERGGTHASNPLQEPFAARDKAAGAKARRRRRGEALPAALVQEQPLDETSAHWIPDQGVSQCFKCQRGFDLFNRRHHCRSCGRIFCSACSCHRSRLDRADSEKVRVCERCFTYIERLVRDTDR